MNAFLIPVLIFPVASLLGLDLDNIYSPLFPPNEPVSIFIEIIRLICVVVVGVVSVVVFDLCCL